MSAAIDGANYAAARSFALATSTSNASTNIAPGSYLLHATGAACWVRLGAAASNGDSISSQPSTPNGLLWVGADRSEVIDVMVATTINAITASGTGVLRVVGPITRSGR